MVKVFDVVKVGFGQDSHRFLPPEASKPCIIGGVIFEDVSGFNTNSDGDVIYHALCNAITSLTGIPILGAVAMELCSRNGITDSEVYLKAALKSLNGLSITHVAISLEAKRPSFKEYLLSMRQNVARILNLELSQVGMTANSGAGLTDFGCGEGVQCFAVITAVK